MKRALSVLSVVMLAVLVAANADAADKKKKKADAKKGPSGLQLAQRLLKDIELTDEQKEQVEKIGQQYVAKLAAARKAISEAVPADVRKARAEALKAAKAAGKKGKQLREAVDGAVTIPEAVKQAVQEAQEGMKATLSEFRTAVIGVLTEEQKAKLPKQGKGKKKKKDA